MCVLFAYYLVLPLAYLFFIICRGGSCIYFCVLELPLEYLVCLLCGGTFALFVCILFSADFLTSCLHIILGCLMHIWFCLLCTVELPAAYLVCSKRKMYLSKSGFHFWHPYLSSKISDYMQRPFVRRRCIIFHIVRSSVSFIIKLEIWETNMFYMSSIMFKLTCP